MRRSGLISQIRAAACQCQSWTVAELCHRSLELKHLAMLGRSKRELIALGFPLLMESIRRNLGITLHDVQLLCGIEAVHGHITEMKTGEGKTLAAALAAYLFALHGRGIHVVTFNDYLAQRDCQLLRPVFAGLGLTVSCLQADLIGPQRATAYQCDITYGAAKEFGFDFLRDRLLQATSENSRVGIMRGMHYALVDEADSILIDEARTPLIIGLQDEAQTNLDSQLHSWAAQHAEAFVEGEHFQRDQATQQLRLMADGVALVRRLPSCPAANDTSMAELYDYVQNAIKARYDLLRDRDYTTHTGEIVIIDEFTGRPAEGRQWQHGLHQAVQAKEGLAITPTTRTAASVTMQALFRRYKQFAGMTGTAWTSRRELASVYKKRVVPIPTHQPVQRVALPARVFATYERKFEAVALSARQHVSQGRAVLIGTRSVSKSELLADHLRQQGLAFQILNAKQLSQEADVIAQAGQSASVTIATNMAGRGTDIQLSPQVRSAGGLHVILTEIHESQRIDCQLIGRCSRQGDPGSYQIMVSLDDEILSAGFGKTWCERLQYRYANANEPQLDKLFSLFRRAQRRAERRFLVDRLMVLRSDQEKNKLSFATGQDPYLVGG